jgi:hypothetical protein
LWQLPFINAARAFTARSRRFYNFILGTIANERAEG